MTGELVYASYQTILDIKVLMILNQSMEGVFINRNHLGNLEISEDCEIRDGTYFYNPVQKFPNMSQIMELCKNSTVKNPKAFIVCKDKIVTFSPYASVIEDVRNNSYDFEDIRHMCYFWETPLTGKYF